MQTNDIARYFILNVGNLGYYVIYLCYLTESADEGISSSIEIESPEDDVILRVPDIQADPDTVTGREAFASPKVSRVDSVMEQTFVETLVKAFENSKGFLGFRRRVANDINHKYCSCKFFFWAPVVIHCTIT